MNLDFRVPDMACAACVTTIAKAVAAVDATARVDADPKTKQVKIETQHPEAEIKAAITSAGYTIA